MRADIHDGQEQKRSIHGPDTEAQDPVSPLLISACNARPVHTVVPHPDSCSAAKRSLFDHLIGAAEDRARSQSCTEIASDTWIDNEPSQRAHEALSFEVVDRCVHYRKALR